jgi:hypothetical protein
MYLSVPTYW